MSEASSAHPGTNEDPIEQLLAEHVVILAVVDELREATAAVADGGEGALADALPIFRRFSEMTATKLDLHRRKEDDVLFPAIEAYFGEGGAPTGPMRDEHRRIHAEARRFRDTMVELNEIQHPAIEAGSAELQGLLEEGGSADELQRVAEPLADLLYDHFEKEEQILFPLARQVLEQETLDEVAAQFGEMEAAG